MSLGDFVVVLTSECANANPGVQPAAPRGHFVEPLPPGSGPAQHLTVLNAVGKFHTMALVYLNTSKYRKSPVKNMVSCLGHLP